MDRLNADAFYVAPDQQSRGPKLGFFDSLDAAYEAQTRASSRDGLAYYFSELDEKQAEKVKGLGREYTPIFNQNIAPNMEDTLHAEGPNGESMPVMKPYGSRWRAYVDMADSIVNGTDNGWSQYMAAHDEHITKLNEADPTLQLKTTREMFDEVRNSAKLAEQRNSLPSTVMGSVGAFMGSAAGALDPRTDIFNTATLPVGGFGKTALLRIATQAGGQGMIEAINQVTGVQRNRDLLGLEHGTGNALWQIGGAMAGGAALQGLGEGFVAGVRRWRTGRWFADTPTDPAPPRPASEDPIGPVRTTPEFEAAWARAMNPQARTDLYAHPVGRPRADADMAHVTSVLHDWGGARPWEIAPPTETRLPGRTDQTFEFKVEPGVGSVDSIARRVDPDAFRTYDKLNARREELRQQLRNPDEIARIADTAASASETRAQLAQLRGQLDDTMAPRARKKLENRIAALQDEYSAAFKNENVDAPGSPEAMLSQVQQSLLKTEKDIRDLKPTIERAYGRAQNKWTAYNADRERIDEMLKSGASGIDDIPAKSAVPEKFEDFVKEVHPAVAEARAMRQPGEAVTQAARRIYAEREKIADDAIDDARTQATRMALDEESTHYVVRDAAGVEHQLDLNTKFHMDLDDDGIGKEMSLREWFKELRDDEQAMQAVTTCSLNATS